MVTASTSPFCTLTRKSLKLISWSAPWKPVEKFQIRTPTTTRTIQNSRLLSVEFNPGLLNALLSRVSRLPRAQ
jgi:hypothetical protein